MANETYLLDTSALLNLHKKVGDSTFLNKLPEGNTYLIPWEVIEELQTKYESGRRENGKEVCPWYVPKTIWDAVNSGKFQIVYPQVDEAYKERLAKYQQNGSGDKHNTKTPGKADAAIFKAAEGLEVKVVTDDTDFDFIKTGAEGAFNNVTLVHSYDIGA